MLKDAIRTILSEFQQNKNQGYVGSFVQKHIEHSFLLEKNYFLNQNLSTKPINLLVLAYLEVLMNSGLEKHALEFMGKYITYHVFLLTKDEDQPEELYTKLIKLNFDALMRGELKDAPKSKIVYTIYDYFLIREKDSTLNTG